MQCDQLTDAEIEQKIQEMAAALKEQRQYVDLAQVRGLPYDRSTQNQAIESYQKIIANLEKDIEDLLAARAKRQSGMKPPLYP